MPSEREIQIAGYQALADRAVHDDFEGGNEVRAVATGELAELLDRAIENNLDRVDRLDNRPIDELYPGAPIMRLRVVTEWFLVTMGTQVRVKTYVSEQDYLGTRPRLSDTEAFLRAEADIDTQMLNDPPYNYIDNGLEEIRRGRLAEQNARNAGGAILRRIDTMTVKEAIQKLTNIRERAIRRYPFTSDGSRQPRGDLVFGESQSPNTAMLNARLAYEMEAIRDELGAVEIRRILFDTAVDGEQKTQIAYNFAPESSRQDGPRYKIGKKVSPELKSRYEALTRILYDGDLPPEPERESIEELEAELEQARQGAENFFYARIINAKLEEAEAIKLGVEGRVGEEITYDVVNQDFDFLKEKADEIWQILEGREANSYWAARELLGDDEANNGMLVDPDWAWRETKLVAFVGTIKNFIYEIEIVVREFKEAQDRELQELLNSPKRDTLLTARSFIVVGFNGKSMEFRLPIEKNDKSIQVLAIKRYLGFSFSSGDLFDNETKENLQSFQDLNHNAFADLAEEELGRFPAGQGVADVVPDEYGRIGPFTFLTMKSIGGLERAVTETIDYLNGALPAEVEGTDAASQDVLARERARDGYKPPWSDAKYYYFMHVTEETRETVNSDIPDSYNRFMRENAEISLRRGVESLFEYHARSKTWTVEGKISEHAVFNRLLRFQNKIETKMNKDQRFAMTIDPQTLAENLGVGDDPKVDVLFGQDLKVGATPMFASIAEVHSPTERPNSKFKITVRIRKDMFEQVTTDPSRTMTIGQAIDAARRVSSAVRSAVNDLPDARRRLDESARERHQQVLEEIDEKTKSVNDGISWVKNNKKEAIEKGAAGAWGLAKKFSRSAERARQFGATNIGDSLSKKQEAAFIAALRAMETRDDSYPSTKSYTLYKINTMIDAVANMFEEFASDFDEFGQQGGRIRPAIDLREEAKNLRAVKPALTSFLSANGIAKRDFLREDTRIEISFVEATMMRSVKTEPSFHRRPGDDSKLTEEEIRTLGRESDEEMKARITPELFNEMTPMERDAMRQGGAEFKVEDRAGSLPISVHYKLPNKKKILLQQASLVLGQQYPWNVPRTMNYLANLHNLYDEANDYEASCLTVGLDEKMSYSERDPIEIIKIYTTPSLIVLPLEPGPTGLSVKTDKIKIFGPIKRSEQRLKEDLDMTGDGPLARRWREGIIRTERNKTYQITPEIPTVELCDLESLFGEFLDKFDLKALFCNYAACIPDLPWPPSFSWDLEFTLPELPRIPSFDPIAIIIPRIELAVLDLVLGFLCGLIRGILDLIRFPDCEDLANFGKATWQELWNKSNEETGQRVLIVQDAARVMDDLDIPRSVYPDISRLFDQLALILTPAELCSLLDNSADAEVLSIVLQLIQRSFPELKIHFQNEADIAMFFMLLGKFVDPDVCNRVANMSNIILGDVFCPDRPATTLRRRMQENKATSEEIAKAMAEAEERRQSFKDLFDRDPMQGLVPSPGSEGMPGPYDNEVSREMSKMATDTAMDIVETMLKNDLISFIPSLMDTAQSQRVLGDPGYNPLEAAEFDHIKASLERMDTSTIDSDERQLQQLSDVELSQLAEENARLAAQQRGRRQSAFITGAESRNQEDISDEFVEAGLRDVFQDITNQGAIPNDIAIRVYGDTGTLVVYDISDPNSPRALIDGNTDQDGGIRGGTAESRAQRALEVIRSELGRRKLEETQIPKPGKITKNDDGSYSISAMRDEDDNIVAFNLQDPQDVKTITDIMSFPIRNMKPETKIAPFLVEALDQSKVKTNVEKKFTSAYNFYDEEVAYASPEQLKALGDFANRSNQGGRDPEDRNLEIKLKIGNPESEGQEDLSITYQEIPINSGLKDCYNLHFPGRLFNDDRSSGLIWRGKTYNKDLPPPFAERRALVRDMHHPGYKLLRPAAFAEAFLSSWDSGAIGDRTNREQVEGYATNLWNKLQGNTTNPGAGDAKLRSEYEAICENFVDDISQKISSSRFFDFDEIKKLARDLTAEYTLSADGTCYIENAPFINFEKLREDITESYLSSLSQEEYDPVNRDFSKPGPLEDSLSGQLVHLYVKTFLIEFMLRGLFVFSLYRPGPFFADEAIKDYVNIYMRASLEQELSRDIGGLFADEIRKVANDSDLSQAIRNLVDSVTSDIDFIESIEEKFQPQFGSYKEQLFINLAREVRDVQDFKNILPPSMATRDIHAPRRWTTVGGAHSNSRRGFVPAHGTFGGSISSDAVGISRLERGHFYLEKYYRLSGQMVARYITGGQSLLNRIIQRAKVEDRDAREVQEVIYDVRQYEGVFSRAEMDMLFEEFKNILKGNFAADLSEEVNGFIEDASRSGNLFIGTRLIYLPRSGGLAAPLTLAP